MVFSDGQIRYFSWRLRVGQSCGKDIWHVGSCYLQCSVWKDFRSVPPICERVENTSLFSNNKWDLVALIVCTQIFFPTLKQMYRRGTFCIKFFTDVPQQKHNGPQMHLCLMHRDGTKLFLDVWRTKIHTSSTWVVSKLTIRWCREICTRPLYHRDPGSIP